MEVKSFFAQDSQGNIIPGANCTVFIAGTASPAVDLIDKYGDPLTNPFQAGDNGEIEFGAPDGDYDIRVTSAGKEQIIRAQFNDVGTTVKYQELAAPGGAGLIGNGGIVFDSVSDMKAAAWLTAGQKVRTLGYYNPGDGGGNDYEIVATGTGTDDGGSFIDLSGSGLQARGLFNLQINLRQFGAVGIGLLSQAEDTSAIDAYFAYIEANPSKDGDLPNGTRNIIAMYDAIIFNVPAGQYYYNGTGYTPTNEKVLVIRGESPDSSTIVINSDVHLIHPTAASKVMNYVEFSNIKILGGRGAFFNEKTDVGNVAHGKRVSNCVFGGYTSVAFGSLQLFDARWSVNQTFFEGGNIGTPVGLLLPHEIAEPDISGTNTFAGNKYDIIMTSDGISEFVIGPSNSFFNIAGRSKSADVWIIPGDSSHGFGVRLFGNRFSNEHLDPSNPNILIADRDGATPSHVFSHSTTKSSGVVTGLTIESNSINSTGNPSLTGVTGYIKSYTPNISGLRFVGNPIGQWRPCIIEYDPSISASEIDSGGAPTNYVELNMALYGPNRYKPINLSNIPGAGLITYENGINVAGYGMLDSTSDGTVGYQNIHTGSSVRLWNKGANVTVTNINDVSGGATAATFTYGADQVVIAGLTVGNIRPGYHMWLEFDVKASSATPLDAIQCEYVIRGKEIAYTIPLTGEWQRARIPIICASGGHTGSTFFIQFAPRLFLDVGVRDSFDIGRFCAYHSQGPVPYSVSGI